MDRWNTEKCLQLSTDLQLLDFFHLYLDLFGAFLILHPQSLKGNLPVLCGISVVLECILESSP